ncbi:MAG: T9SS type A sorting domain-containing protein [Bacteroidales bacterium]
MTRTIYLLLFFVLIAYSKTSFSQQYTINIPEVEYTELEDFYFVGQEVQCTARVYSYGLVDDLCAIYYEIFKDDFSSPVVNLTQYGNAKFTIRSQGTNYVTQQITEGSGYFSVKPLFTTYKAFTLGIFDNWCVSRNRPVALSMTFTEPGLYKFNAEIQKCSNSGTGLLGQSFTSNGNEGCGEAGTSHADKAASSCNNPQALFSDEIIISVCDENQIAFIDGETEYCSGDELFLTYSIGNNDDGIDEFLLPEWVNVDINLDTKTASLSGIIPDYDEENSTIEFDVKSISSYNPENCPGAVINQSITILPSENSFENVEICQGNSYTFFGEEFSYAGDYQIIVENSYGCDDRYNLSLSVNPVYDNTLNIQVCENGSYEFAGENYTENTNITHTFTTVHGCDSIINLNLEFVELFEKNLNEAICEGESYFIGDEEIFETGEYSYTFESINGCDSIVNLNLTVNPTNEITLNETINQGETFIINEEELTEAGEYTFNLVNEFGCDSIINLNLTVITKILSLETLENQISVYPNPTNTILYINIDERINSMIFISLTDISGKVIINNQKYSNNESIDLSSLKAGIYFLNIYKNTDRIATKLIMKE